MPNEANATIQASNNTGITQSFRDQKQLETLIRTSKLMKIIEGATQIFINRYQNTKKPEDALAAVIVKLPFSYADFLKQSESLLHLTLEEPQQFEQAAKYTAYSIVKDLVKKSTNDSGLRSIDIDQVHVQLLFLGLPLQKELCFAPAQSAFHTGLSHVWGILSAITKPEEVVVQSVWYCSTGCNRNKIKAGATDAPVCSSCSQPMCEYTKLRHTQNICLLRLLPLESIQTPRVLNKIFRAVTVRVRDHNYDCELLLGERYLVTGFYDYRQGTQEFQAWNLMQY